MRVTAGKFKGRQLIENKLPHVRPTADMVKQAIFNKIAFDLSNAYILDLCAGTGALGIEAISRGAKKVVFVDKNAQSLKLVKQNIQNLNCQQQAELVKADAATFCQECKEKFDFILFDPPYQSGLYLPVAQKICQSGILKEGGIFISEQARNDEFDFSSFFDIIDVKMYGNKKVVYMKNKI